MKEERPKNRVEHMPGHHLKNSKYPSQHGPQQGLQQGQQQGAPQGPKQGPQATKKRTLPPRSPFKNPYDIKQEQSPVDQYDNQPLDKNTGFQADTIIVESGFRPIFRREDITERDDSIERDERSSSGGFSRRSDNFEDDEEFIEEPESSPFFEPMFIPSPRDNIDNKSNAQIDSMEAEASEKEEFFYLPPNESKRSAVTYDAKAVLDTSLLSDPLPSPNDFVKLSSKTKQFIKAHPLQFGPFTGEIPTDLRHQISVSSNRGETTRITSTKLSALTTNAKRKR